MSEELRHLYSIHATEQSKYVYFLLAATGAALGYALRDLDGLVYTPFVWPGLLAIVSWLLSFLFGCKHIAALQNARSANADLLTAKEKHLPAQTIESIYGAFHASNKWVSSSARWQFILLAAGVVLFTGWRVSGLFVPGAAP